MYYFDYIIYLCHARLEAVNNELHDLDVLDLSGGGGFFITYLSFLATHRYNYKVICLLHILYFGVKSTEISFLCRYLNSKPDGFFTGRFSVYV